MTLVVDPSIDVPASAIPSLSAAQMAEVDRLAVDEHGISLLQMMEQAGSHLAEVIRIELGGSLVGRDIVVATGPGNNGGGGLTAARHLANRGAEVRVVLASPAMRSTEASRHQLASLIAMGADCCVATYDLPDADVVRAMSTADVIVDAILGYSLKGPPRGDVERLISFVLQADRPVISLDLPSGLDPDTGSVPGVAITAAATMTLALPKVGLLKREGLTHVGRLYLADIGLPTRLYAALGIQVDSPFVGSRIVKMDIHR